MPDVSIIDPAPHINNPSLKLMLNQDSLRDVIAALKEMLAV